MKIRGFFEKESTLSVLGSVCAVISGLLISFIILLFSDSSNALAGFGSILLGGFNGGLKGIGNVIFQAIPIIMTGLAVALAFRTGVFNIGTAGQFIMGAFTAVFIGVKWTFLPAGIHWIAALLGGFIAGAVWAFVPAVLHAHFQVNAVVSAIMMNYVGMYTANYLITNTVYNAAKNQSKAVAATAVAPKAGMNVLFPGSSLNAGIIVVILVVIILQVLISKTVFGYEIKACGMNRQASLYAGISAKKRLVQSFMFSGGLAGLGGALAYLAGDGKCISVVDVLAGDGFTGIAVALLGLNSPVGALLAGLLISYLEVGGFYTQVYKYPVEIIDITIAVIVYFGAFAVLVKGMIRKLLQRKGGKE